jgi:hypothetical protein
VIPARVNPWPRPTDVVVRVGTDEGAGVILAAFHQVLLRIAGWAPDGLVAGVG